MMGRCIIGMMVCVCAAERWATAQTNQPPLVQYVSAALLEGSDSGLATRELANQQTPGLGKWEKFEIEFGIRQKDPTLVGGALQSAKYRLDRALFTVQDWVDNVEHALRFEYDIARPFSGASANASRRAYSNPLLNALEGGKLKSDVDLSVPKGSAYLGMKLEFPLGD
jgi:hypothetical protein